MGGRIIMGGCIIIAVRIGFWLFVTVAIFVVGAIGCCAAATSAKIVAVANTAIKNVASITVCRFMFFLTSFIDLSVKMISFNNNF